MNKQQLVEHTIKSIENAKNHISNINNEILGLEGQSSANNRHFLNNITKIENCNYLEIGCWKGSTIISALFNNEQYIKNYHVIDNFSEFEGSKDIFVNNFKSIINKEPNLIDKDCFSIYPLEYNIRDINVYFYDGNHRDECHMSCLAKYLDCMSSEFIFIVDDFDNPYIAKYTKMGIKGCGVNVLYETELKCTNGMGGEWWNGLYVGVLSKS